jgi:hypothetical protein
MRPRGPGVVPKLAGTRRNLQGYGSQKKIQESRRKPIDKSEEYDYYWDTIG